MTERTDSKCKGKVAGTVNTEGEDLYVLVEGFRIGDDFIFMTAEREKMFSSRFLYP